MTAQTAQVDAKAFAGAVAFAARILPPRPQVPALGCIPVTVGGGTLTCSVFDYDNASKATVPCEAEEGTAFTAYVSGRHLAQMAASMQRGTVRLTYDDALTMQCGATKFTLRTIPADGYPALPPLPPQLGTVSGAELANAVNRVAFAVSTSDPNMMGVFVEANADGLWLAATDMFRIAACRIDWDPRDVADEFALVLPAAHLIGAGKSLASEQKLMLACAHAEPGRGSFAIDAGWRHITGTRLLPQKVTPWRKIMDQFTARVHADVETTALANAVRRVLLANNQEQPGIDFVFSDGQIELKSQTTDLADANDAVAASVEGDLDEPVQVRFNAQFLLAALGAVDSEMTRIALNGSTKAMAMVNGLGSDGEPTSDYRHMLAAIKR